ncbi:MAG: TylF/MycF/NovP-related O-methyltransferase [Anaerolineae bacterium]
MLSKLKSKSYPLKLFFTDFQKFQVIYKVKSQRISYKSFEQLSELYDIIKSLEAQDVAGEFIEAGCALGGSAVVISAAKQQARPFHLYDTFEMIPPPSEKDGEDVHERYEIITQGKATGISGDTYYGYQDNLLDEVTNTFTEFQLPTAAHNITMHKGLFEDTLSVDHPVAMAHLDCDWYESVLVCLQQIVPNLTVGGLLIIDDYNDWSGCKQAIDEYFSDKQADFRFDFGSQLLIWRTNQST